MTLSSGMNKWSCHACWSLHARRRTPGSFVTPIRLPLQPAFLPQRWLPCPPPSFRQDQAVPQPALALEAEAAPTPTIPPTFRRKTSTAISSEIAKAMSSAGRTEHALVHLSLPTAAVARMPVEFISAIFAFSNILAASTRSTRKARGEAQERGKDQARRRSPAAASDYTRGRKNQQLTLLLAPHLTLRLPRSRQHPVLLLIVLFPLPAARFPQSAAHHWPPLLRHCCLLRYQHRWSLQRSSMQTRTSMASP